LEYRHEDTGNFSTAYSKNESICISLHLPRKIGACATAIELYDCSRERLILKVTGEWCKKIGASELYQFLIAKDVLDVGLMYFRVVVNTCNKIYYSHKNNSKLEFNTQIADSITQQLSIYERLHPLPQALYGGIIYHIFVDRFNRGGRSQRHETDRLIQEWGVVMPEYPEYPGAPLKNNTVYGGTLDGVREKLDYIASLGVTAIYLSPIFESVSNHKYDTADYMTVDSGFGGDPALVDLISACNERKIKIILDGVFNHTGSDSVYFNRYGRYDALGAYQSIDSQYYKWYNFKNHPNDYTSWWGIEILPRINPDIQECREYFVGDNGVIHKYAQMGIYGFRLDVADELSDDFIKEIKSQLSKHGENVLYGEVWEDASNKISYGKRRSYYLGAELDGVMNYPLRTGIIEYIRNRNTEKLRYALTDIINNAPKEIANLQMNLLGTHDTERILTIMGGISSFGKSNDELAHLKMSEQERALAVSRTAAAYTILATLPGIPVIFYGDEAGLEGYGDPFNRMPYPWDKVENKLLEHYRTIGSIRADNIFKCSDFKLHLLDENSLIFSRSNGNRMAIIAYNNSNIPAQLKLSGTAYATISKKEGHTFTLAPTTAEIFFAENGETLEILRNTNN
jgi:glycosidase